MKNFRGVNYLSEGEDNEVVCVDVLCVMQKWKEKMICWPNAQSAD